MPQPGLPTLSGMINLKEVFLYGTAVTDDGEELLETLLPEVRVEKDRVL